MFVRSYNVAQHLKACATTTRDIKGRRKRMACCGGGGAKRGGGGAGHCKRVA